MLWVPANSGFLPFSFCPPTPSPRPLLTKALTRIPASCPCGCPPPPPNHRPSGGPSRCAPALIPPHALRSDFDLQPPCPTATSYSHFMVLKQTVKFCHLAQTSKIVCTLDLTLDMPISEVRHCLATHLELDASFIQLTGQTLDYKPRRYPFREDSTVPGRETRLLDMVTVCWSRTANILYYEVRPRGKWGRPITRGFSHVPA